MNFEYFLKKLISVGQYGLDNPVCTVAVADAEHSYQIQLGSYSSMDSKRYVSIGDGNVYLVQKDPLDYFDTDLSSMIDNDKTPEFGQITAVQFDGEQDYSIAYIEDSTDTYSAEDVYFARQDGKNLPLDTARVNTYLWTISSLDLTNYVSYNATDEELRSYGLDAPDLTITAEYAPEMEDESGNGKQDTFVLRISRDPEEKAAAEKEAENGEETSSDEAVTAYIRAGESQIVYRISSSDYKKLMAASYGDLRHREIVRADFADVRQIDISLEGADYTIISEKDNDSRTYFYQGEELEIKSLKNAIQSLSADSFTSERPSQKEEISLTVYLDNENCTQILIELYRYDGSDCLAVVDGQPVSLVERTFVVDLIEAVHAIVLD